MLARVIGRGGSSEAFQGGDFLVGGLNFEFQGIVATAAPTPPQPTQPQPTQPQPEQQPLPQPPPQQAAWTAAAASAVAERSAVAQLRHRFPAALGSACAAAPIGPLASTWGGASTNTVTRPPPQQPRGPPRLQPPARRRLARPARASGQAQPRRPSRPPSRKAHCGWEHRPLVRRSRVRGQAQPCRWRHPADVAECAAVGCGPRGCGAKRCRGQLGLLLRCCSAPGVQGQLLVGWLRHQLVERPIVCACRVVAIGDVSTCSECVERTGFACVLRDVRCSVI